MALAFHIIIALASVGVATLVFFAPSSNKLRISYSLIGLTVASGTLLVLLNPAHMLRACTVGLLYVGATSVLTVIAQRKLASERIRIDRD
jgi:hypothetical protein